MSRTECQNYVPGQGNKGRRRRPESDDPERQHKRQRMRTKLPSAKVHSGSKMQGGGLMLDKARELSQGVETFEVEALAVEGD